MGANVVADQVKRSAQAPEADRLDSRVHDPADSGFEEVERRAQLFRLVDQLPENQRRVILLRFAEEKNIREIALELGRTEGAVRQLQFRGLENLRARMGESHG
jgi:RNA polymerase sigma-70 factor (ECF subfamily)